MNAWLDFVTKLQKYTSFALSWSTSEECRNLDIVVPNQMLAENVDAVDYKIEEF